MDFSKQLFNCASIEKLLTNSKTALSETQIYKMNSLLLRDNPTAAQKRDLEKLLAKSDLNSKEKNISDGCKTYLLDLYIRKRYGYFYKLLGGVGAPVQMKKGKKTERSCVNLLSSVTGKTYYQDKRKIKNDFLVGIIDIMDAEVVEESTIISEIKSSFSIHDFLKMVNKSVRNHDALQVQGYLAITGKESGEVHYCLVDYPPQIIAEQKELLFKTMCPRGKETQEFIKKWSIVEKSLHFDNIPDKERVLSYLIKKDNQLIDSIYEKVYLCREWLMDFHEIHENHISLEYS
jgi:hypothetical protein